MLRDRDGWDEHPRVSPSLNNVAGPGRVERAPAGVLNNAAGPGQVWRAPLGVSLHKQCYRVGMGNKSIPGCLTP